MNLASTVHDRCTPLVNAMPVNARRLIPKQVVDMYDDAITSSSPQLRARPEPIDRDDRPLKAIRSSIDPLDVPRLLHGLRQRQRRSQQRKEKRAHNEKSNERGSWPTIEASEFGNGAERMSFVLYSCARTNLLPMMSVVT